MSQVSIKRVEISSALKFGCALGALLSIGAGLACGIIIKAITGTLRVLLESWQNLEVLSILGQSVRVNLTERLGLLSALKTLQMLDGLSWLTFLGFILAIVVLGGAIFSLFTAAGAAIYNLMARISGGVKIEIG